MFKNVYLIISSFIFCDHVQNMFSVVLHLVSFFMKLYITACVFGYT